MTKNNQINMGRIGAAHGIKGSLRIKSYTQNPLDLGAYGPLHDEEGNTYTIKNIRPQKTMVIVRFKEVTSRDMAEPLNGVELYVAQDKIPASSDEDTFYIKDLVGMDVIDKSDALIGTIIDVPNFGAGNLLEIAPKKEHGDGFSDATYYLAFTKTNVPQIDFDKKFVKIDPPVEVSEKDIELEEEIPNEPTSE